MSNKTHQGRNNTPKRIAIKYDKILVMAAGAFISIMFSIFVIHSTIAAENIDTANEGINEAQSSTYEIMVSEGKTLWDIAIEHLPDNTDPRDYINQIKEVNDLKEAKIHPGQTLEIPEQ